MSVKVLVVDDMAHVRNMLANMLELDGFDVVGQAANGKEAVDLTSEAAPDVVVMDYKMPDMDGLKAAEAIKETHPDQAIILYTAFMKPGLEEQARASGVAMCIGKVEGLHQLERQITELGRDLG